MKIIFHVFILITISFSALAQKADVKLQPVFDLQEARGMYIGPAFNDMTPVPGGYLSFIPEMTAKVGMGSKMSKVVYEVTLIKHNKSMKVEKMSKADPATKYGPFQAMIEQVGNKYYFFYYEQASNEEAVRISASEIDLSTLALSSPKGLMKFNQKDVGIMKAMDVFNANKLRVERSPDNNKFLLYRESGVDNSFSFAVLDKDLNILRSKDKVIEIPDDIVVTSSCIDNAGNVYIGYKVEGRKTGVKGHIYISPNAGTEKDILISDDEMYQVLLIPSVKQNIIHVAGNNFAAGEKYISGVYSAKLKIDGMALTDYKKTDLDEKLIESFSQHKLAFTSKNKYGLVPFRMKGFEMEDGTVNIIGNLTRHSSQGEGRDITHSYMSGSMLNATFRNNKTVISRIPRNRESYEPIGEGFFAFPYKNSVIVLYNDYESNLSKPITEMPGSSDYKDAVLVSAVISADGSISRSVVVDLKDDNFIALPETSVFSTPDSLALLLRKISRLGIGGSQLRWAEISIR